VKVEEASPVITIPFIPVQLVEEAEFSVSQFWNQLLDWNWHRVAYEGNSSERKGFNPVVDRDSFSLLPCCTWAKKYAISFDPQSLCDKKQKSLNIIQMREREKEREREREREREKRAPGTQRRPTVIFRCQEPALLHMKAV
jgi:hypothetical protein